MIGHQAGRLVQTHRQLPADAGGGFGFCLKGLAPAALSVADEAAVRDFLAGRIRYVDIPAILEKAIAAPERWLPDGLGL